RRCGELHVARDPRLSQQLGRQRGRELGRLDAERGQDARDDPAGLIDERGGEVLDVELRVALVARFLLRGDERLLRLFCELIGVDHFKTFLTGSACRPCLHASTVAKGLWLLAHGSESRSLALSCARYNR